ncbi:catalase family peroxidase [Amycolatopsis saalfeldensis]|uniref:Catalase-related peroxidase n=1 Tax=Amycolatopsis saalfeldensis TaxID=394193 RepID=A0A1H8T6P7_9PSEU|nr:catalase family peroxidase [Amycolatopsis saalfeldensis]SEO86264.1 catalase [Amycolatopsis saalfeldensis]
MTSELPASQLSSSIVDEIEQLKGTFPGYRRAHARGVCYDATFVPSGVAADLTTAAHLGNEPVAATVRFSHTDTDPHLPDADRAVRGFATKFHLPGGGTTDLVTINLDRFIASTPEDFLHLLEAAEPDPATGAPDLAKVQAHVAAHPSAGPALAAAAKLPTPRSYGTTTYWAVHAFLWRGADGVARPVRYRWEPVAGEAVLGEGEGADWSATQLTEELAQRLGEGPVEFTLKVQLGEPGDPTHDSTLVWPAERTEVTAGRLSITAEVADQEHWAAQVFDPTQLTPGIELSDDPVLAARSAIYAVSYDRRSHGR